MVSSSLALLHAAWITAVIAVCLALCTIHSRKSSSGRRGSRSASTHSSRPREGGNGGGATPAKVSPTPSDMAKGTDELQAPRGGHDDVQDGVGPVTVIDVGTHGPIAPVFPVPDPLPPRRSLSVKHIRFAERLERIRSRRWGGGDEEEAASSGVEPEDSTLWAKTIILGERCRVPSGDEDDGDMMIRWKSYRPRQPRSVPVTRSNSFAAVDSRGSA